MPEFVTFLTITSSTYSGEQALVKCALQLKKEYPDDIQTFVTNSVVGKTASFADCGIILNNITDMHWGVYIAGTISQKTLTKNTKKTGFLKVSIIERPDTKTFWEFLNQKQVVPFCMLLHDVKKQAMSDVQEKEIFTQHCVLAELMVKALSDEDFELSEYYKNLLISIDGFVR